MADIHTLIVFLLVSFVLLVTPGPAVLYIVAQGLDTGRAASLVATLGVAVGTFCHVAAAALGLSALLVSSALAFNVLKYAGAAYLIYLGIRTLMTGARGRPTEIVKAKTLRRIWSEGVLLQVLNPKIALFFFAFLPQFVDPSRGGVTSQFFVLGLIFVGLSILTDGLYALSSGAARKWLRQDQLFVRGQRYLTGGILIGLGVATAVTGSGRK